MDFYAVLARVIELLQREGRTSHRTLNAKSPSMMSIWQNSRWG
jgi:hypothetical protein